MGDTQALNYLNRQGIAIVMAPSTNRYMYEGIVKKAVSKQCKVAESGLLLFLEVRTYATHDGSDVDVISVVDLP